MSIRITSYKSSNAEGRTVGYVSFNMSKTKMFYNDCPVIRRKDGGFFVSAPSRKYQNKDGEDKYLSYWGFYDKEYSIAFQKLLMDELGKHWDKMRKEQEEHGDAETS